MAQDTDMFVIDIMQLCYQYSRPDVFVNFWIEGISRQWITSIQCWLGHVSEKCC